MGNVHMEATQINYREGNKKMSVAQAIKNAGSEITPEEKEWIDTIPELASQEIIAPEFDAEEGVYAVGDLVIYQGGLYKFTTAHETAGAWNPEEVAAVKVSEELSSLESGLIDNICSGVKIKSGYKAYDADVITFDTGNYIFIAVKPLYGNSAIYTIDGSNTPQLLCGKDLSIAQTVDDGRISLSFVGNYMQFMLVRLRAKADFTDEIHLAVATPTP